MKRFYFSILSSLLLICLAGCSSNAPESIAKEFVLAYFSCDFEKAKTLSTPDTSKGLELLSKMAQSEDFKENKEKMPKITSIKADGCQFSEDGSEATVSLTVTADVPNKEGKIESQTDQIKVDMKKIDEKWLVVFKVK